MPSRGIQGLRKYGRQLMSTAMLGTSASAFSSRRLPMKHHGQTTSDTTSTRSAVGAPDELDMTHLRAVVSYNPRFCIGPQPRTAIWGRGLARRNAAHNAGDQRIDIVGRLQRCQRHG